jgi:hypothetical protein
VAWSCSNPVKVQVEETTSNDFVGGGGDLVGDPDLSNGAACVGITAAAEQRRVAMYMMLDSSGSMEEPTGTGATKWQAIQRSIRGFVGENRDSDLSMGLQFFPLAKPGSRFVCTSHADCGPDGGPCFLTTCRQGTTITLCESQADCPGGSTVNPCVKFGLCENSDPASPLACEFPGTCADGLGRCEEFERTCTNATQCDVAAYATPAVEIGLIGDQLVAIDRALAIVPQGLTPTVPALQGAVDHAREWALTHPDTTVVAVLATDGLPSECGPEVEGATPPIERVLDIARTAQQAAIPIRTFVIGVFQPGDGGSINNVNAIAQAGGTEEAVFIDTSGEVETQFLDALRAIRSGTLACQFQIPDSEENLDYFRVNLQFDNGAVQQQLSYVPNEAGCANSPNSWHYDVDASASSAKPTAIQVCPAMCEQFKAAPTGSLSLQLGCATILR